MIARCLLILLLLPGAAGAGLQARLDHGSLALGEALGLTLTGSGLDRIDLAPLNADFQVQAATLSRSGKQETLVLSLYPLHLGKCILPALHAGTARSRALPVTVTDGSAQTPRVWFRVETDPSVPNQRQAFRLTMEACDDDSLAWKRPLLPRHVALYARPLGEEQREVNRNGVRCTAHRWHWAVIPTQAGRVSLRLAMLEANKFGRVLRFPAPAPSFAVAAVPGWLPLDVAIGRPHIEADGLPLTWPRGRPLAWHIEVVGGYSEDGMKALLAVQSQDVSGFGGYAPTVETLAPENHNSAQSRLRLTFYSRAETRGLLRLPKLVFPWYDPDRGRLESLATTGGELRVVDPALEAFLHWLPFLLGGVALAALCACVAGRSFWRVRKRRHLAALDSSPDLDSLLRTLRAFSLLASPPPAATLGLWRERMRAEACCTGLDAMIEAMEHVRYGEKEEDFARSREHVSRVLRTCRPSASSMGCFANWHRLGRHAHAPPGTR